MTEKIKNIAYESGQIILQIYDEDFEIDYKSDNSPLTKADRLANTHIVSFLKSEYPEYAILAEESIDNDERFSNDYCWIVDPLDGTKEFVKKNGEFTVNIALAHKGKSILGVIYVPVKDEIYYAFRNGGAYTIYDYSKDNNQAIKIQVSDNTEELTLLHSRSHKTSIIDNLIENNKEKIKNVLCAGSSLKGCLIAKGEGDIYYRFGPTMEWDTAAMQCIVEEAGGIFRQMDDSEMTYNRRNILNEKGFYILNRIENKLTL